MVVSGFFAFVRTVSYFAKALLYGKLAPLQNQLYIEILQFCHNIHKRSQADLTAAFTSFFSFFSHKMWTFHCQYLKPIASLGLGSRTSFDSYVAMLQKNAHNYITLE